MPISDYRPFPSSATPGSQLPGPHLRGSQGRPFQQGVPGSQAGRPPPQMWVHELLGWTPPLQACAFGGTFFLTASGAAGPARLWQHLRALPQATSWQGIPPPPPLPGLHVCFNYLNSDFRDYIVRTSTPPRSSADEAFEATPGWQFNFLPDCFFSLSSSDVASSRLD